MNILLQIFNNIVLMFINFLIAIYLGRRFFIVMTNHYKFAAEIMEFNVIVSEARESLDYTTKKILDVMKEIEGDIGQEVYMTHNLTKLGSKISILLQRYAKVEERILEMVKMNDNMESIQIETPKDIEAELKKILKKKKNNKLESIKSLRPNSDNILTE